MPLPQLDRLVELQVGQSITAIKCLSLAEAYLQDHFPRFPVMPGVLMLEAMYQASAWLIRASDQFSHSMVVLREARNVKFQDFVQPGKQLCVHAELMKQEESRVTLKTRGTIDGAAAVSARLILQRYNLADQDPRHAAKDIQLRAELKDQFALLERSLTNERQVQPTH